MRDDRRHARAGRLLPALPLLWLAACGEATWQDVESVEAVSETIRAGDLVRLEPLSFEPLELSGSDFALEKFSFTAQMLDPASAALDVLGKVTILSGSDVLRSTETFSGDTTRWAAGEAQQEIVISFPIMTTYSGEGSLYFYLTDLDGRCVSNIVAWPVTFR